MNKELATKTEGLAEPAYLLDHFKKEEKEEKRTLLDRIIGP